jgi:hypothetical protein
MVARRENRTRAMGAQRRGQPAVAQESLILDARGELTPAQMVEKKVMSLLRGKGSVASQIQTPGLLKGRR